MTVEKWLKQAEDKLKKAGVATARLDALILLEDSTSKDRAWLLANPDFELNNTSELDRQIDRRADHEPLAYIRGKSEFYGREFKVTPATLQPRPETETMLEMLVKQSKIKNIVDVGTGSGAIAITAKLELPGVEVRATEINKDALEIAKRNAKNLGADIKFYSGNLLDPVCLLDGFDVVLANLPYVPDKYELNSAAKYEPKLAIFGGEDGLDLYRELFIQITNFGHHTPLVMTESLPFQHEDLTRIARNAGYKLEITNDFIQLFIRVQD